MTTDTPDNGLLPVTQADRQLYAALVAKDKVHKRSAMTGECDDYADMQYIVRHRISTQAPNDETVSRAVYEAAVKGRQDFRDAYRSLLPVLRASEAIVAIWRAKGRKVDVTEYWDAMNAIDVAVTGGKAKPDPNHLAPNDAVGELVEAAREAQAVLSKIPAPYSFPLWTRMVNAIRQLEAALAKFEPVA